jgi:hypothetical protein
MKAEDLMIGDWVKTNPSCGKLACDIKSSIARVSEIGFSTSDGMYVSFVGIKGRYYDDEIEPIPLTVEILEKNGCKKWTWHNYPHENVATYAIGDGIQVEVTKKDGFWLVDNCSDSGDYGYESNWIANVNYVHKLQHLIRDLEIEKEINI